MADKQRAGQCEAQYDILIIGAGAAGLMCGYLLGKKGFRVTILEKNTSAGRKLLATGNGRCNFTNRHLKPACYYGNADFVESVLHQVDDEKVIELFEEIGIYHKEREGYCYPYSGQAASVVSLLMQACLKNNVVFKFDTRVTKIVHKTDGYIVNCKNNIRFECRKLIMACGGKAYESLGGDGSGYKLCRSLSHHVTDIFPGLTGLCAAGEEWKSLAGVRMQGKITLYLDGAMAGCENGEIQIVKDGISGIPVFQLCRLAASGLAYGQNVSCHIDFFPDMGKKELEQWITEHGVEALEGLVNRKWVPVIGKKAGRTADGIAAILKDYKITITDTFGLERAQVTAGGVVTDEVSPTTMQSELHEHLYLVGELLDVDGICGGYNLHFAWSTAYICAAGIERNE